MLTKTITMKKKIKHIPASTRPSPETYKNLKNFFFFNLSLRDNIQLLITYSEQTCLNDFETFFKKIEMKNKIFKNIYW